MRPTIGKRYRVIREGGSLLGMQPHSGYGVAAFIGWGKLLEVGDIITCNSHRSTFGDGVPVYRWTGEHGEHLAADCEFQPSQGTMWTSEPSDDGVRATKTKS